MALKIRQATDPIEIKTLLVCITGGPGVGKTSLGCSADDALLLDFDHGIHRSKNRSASVQVDNWADVASITQADLAKHKTLIIDTAGRMADALAVDIITKDPKNGRGGSLTLPGFGVLKGRFSGWLNLIRSFGLDVVLLCHADEQRKGDELIERLDILGSSRNEVHKSTDAMARLYIQGGKRMLNFSPTETAFGKNPGQLPALEIPDDNFVAKPNFLGTVIADIKASLNKLTAVQGAVAASLADWKKRIDKAATMTDFDNLLPEAKTAGEDIKDNLRRLIGKAAKGKGFAFSKDTGHFDLAEPSKGAA